MVKIRLFRTGGRSKPFYRIVAADSRSPRSGRFIEILGHYDPKTNPAQVDFKENRIRYWVERGAQLTKTVEVILRKQGFFRDQERPDRAKEKGEGP